LSNLSGRFQTLEDLHTELRELSQSLNKELVDLVNDNHQDFLSLGSTLGGGEDRIEDVRVGLLGFQRDIASIRDKISGRRNEVADLLERQKSLKQEVGVARTLLEIAERTQELEQKLMIGKPEPKPISSGYGSTGSEEIWGNDWISDRIYDSDEDYEDEENNPAPKKLKTRVEQYLMIEKMIARLDQKHPFITAQRARLSEIYDTIILDLEAADSQQWSTQRKNETVRLRSLMVK